jgi:hypothetical protein
MQTVREKFEYERKTDSGGVGERDIIRQTDRKKPWGGGDEERKRHLREREYALKYTPKHR